ncbi:YbfB/YjiJ family MFS transporter [Nocardia sp. NPDC101769]|uniref:YbfB/YjiJ family MFS transporter n=1 Tax=Nocardia sp. NPDC101769 TaxID=3364333 RepID=UPI0038112DAC
MGLGRFVYTPILPLMHQQAGLSAQAGAALATANYAGYLAGAVAAMVWPRLTRSTTVFRVTLLVLVASLAGMPLTQDQGGWAALRVIAGIASALIFVTAVSTMLARLPGGAASVGWGFGGIGVGIVFSAVLLLVIGSAGDWRLAWGLAAVLTLFLGGGAWGLRTAVSSGGGPAPSPVHKSGSLASMAALFGSYTLEGAGYIIAGTFLVAAIGQRSPGWVGTAAWGVVGLAAIPSAVLWATSTRLVSHRTVLIAALVVQAVGIALPAAVPGLSAALVAAALFGGTFIGITTLTLALGATTGPSWSVAYLTMGYSVGQIVGPLLAAPVLHSGYQSALLVGATIVVGAAIALLIPHRV